MRRALLALALFWSAAGVAEVPGDGRLERVAIDPGGQIWHVSAHDGVVVWTEGRRFVVGHLAGDGHVEPDGSLVVEGIVDHVACVGQSAVVAIDRYLYFVDLTDPSLPRVTARRDLGIDTSARDLEVLTPFVLSADWRGARLWDTSDPGYPRLLDGWSDAGVRDISVGEAGLGLATGSGFVLLDPGDPRNLVEIGSLPEETNVTSVSVGSSIAVMAQPWAISVIDLTDPTAPEILGRLEDGGSWGDMMLLDDRLVAVLDSGLTFLDVSDPTRPVRLYPGPEGPRADDLAVEGRYLLAAAGSELTTLAHLGGTAFDVVSTVEVPWPHTADRRHVLPGGVVLEQGWPTVRSLVPGPEGELVERNRMATTISDDRLMTDGNLAVLGGYGILPFHWTRDGDLDPGTLIPEVWGPLHLENSVVWVRTDLTEISAFDVSDPDRPTPLGRVRVPLHPACFSQHPWRYPPDAFLHDLAPFGDGTAVVAVVCEEAPGVFPLRQILHLLDLQDPTRPRVVGAMIPDPMVGRFAAAASRVVAVTSRQPPTLASLTRGGPGGLAIAAEAPLPGLLQSMSPFGDRVLAHVRRYGADELLSIDPVTLEMRLIELDSARCPLVRDVSVRFPWVVVTCRDGFGELYRWSESADPPISDR